MLQEHDFSYQNIALPYGLSTGGDDRSHTAKKIFPDDLTGKSVLDIGAKYGYFCFEALKRGATRVLGIDVDPTAIHKARLLADCLGVEANFELLDIETESIHETFDYVLCLNILHHLRNPLSALEKLTSMTRERLVLEVAAIGGHDRKKIGVSFAQQFLLNKAPLIFVSRSGSAGNKSFQKFFITSSAIEHLLKYHTNRFARVDTVPSEHKNRYISIAHKRRIGKLVVIAGPTASGKSTLIKKLQRNEIPEIAHKVGIDDEAQWTVLAANALTTFSEPFVKRAIFHYDFFRSYRRSAQVPQRDEALDVLDAVEHVTFVTLWCPPEILQQRLQQAANTAKTKNGKSQDNKRYLMLATEYADSAKVRAHYQQWFAYTRTKPGEHLIVSLTDEVRCFPLEEWKDSISPFAS